MNSYRMALLAALCVALVGCEGNVTPTEPMSAESAAISAPPAPVPGAPGVAPEGPAEEEPATAEAPAAEGEMPAEAEAPAEEPAAEEPAAEEAAPAEAPAEGEKPADDEFPDEEAKPGVGVKGKDYGGEGLVTTPIQAYFRTGERIAFEIQIPSALKLYKADHNNKGPKTHEEFWKVIIEENAIELPELTEGCTYLYEPKSEQLLVRHPQGTKPE